MLQDILDIEGLKQDSYRIRQEINQAQSTLNGMAAAGANLTTNGVTEARDNFTRLQGEQWIRSLQLEDIERGGTLEGSLQRACAVIMEYCERNGG